MLYCTVGKPEIHGIVSITTQHPINGRKLFPEIVMTPFVHKWDLKLFTFYVMVNAPLHCSNNNTLILFESDH